MGKRGWVVKQEYKGIPFPMVKETKWIELQSEKDYDRVRGMRRCSERSFRGTSCTYAELKRLGSKNEED